MIPAVSVAYWFFPQPERAAHMAQTTIWARLESFSWSYPSSSTEGIYTNERSVPCVAISAPKPGELPGPGACYIYVESVPGGVTLIAAGVSGRSEDLPTSWMQYVALAGIVTLGFALRFLWQAGQSVWPRKATPATDEEESNLTSSTTGGAGWRRTNQ
jgi:hypothetical protein